MKHLSPVDPRCGRRARLVLAFLILICAWSSTAHAAPCSQLTGLTALDRNRCQALETIDGSLAVGTVSTPLNLAGAVQPVLAGGSASESEGDYYSKAMAVFGQLDYGAGSTSRIAEANRVLRYAMFVSWPAPLVSDIVYNPNVGASTKPWALDNRNVAVRSYWLFRNLMDADIRQEFERRFGLLRNHTLTSVSGSQNQKAMHYSAIVLAFRENENPSSAIYSQAVTEITSLMRNFARFGSVEAGSSYDYFTLGAVLNLAEWGAGSAGALATATVDYFLAEQLAFSVGVDLASPGIRRRPHWIFGYREPQTVAADVLFSATPPSHAGVSGLVELVASNYRPLVALRDQKNQQDSLASFEARANHGRFRHHFFRGQNYGIGAHHAPSPQPFFEGSTNDALLVYIQAEVDQRASITSYSYKPYGLKKQLGLNERSIGYKNVAMYQSGGRNGPSNGASGAAYEFPVGMYYNANYFFAEYSASTSAPDACWAFLRDHGNNVFIGWALSRGAVLPWPEQDTSSNKLLQSTYLPASTLCDQGSNGDPACGEIAIFEARDASEFGGNFEAFKANLRGRNSCTMLQPDADQAVRYIAPDLVGLRFGKGVLEVPGRPDFDAVPRFDSPFLNNFQLSVGGRQVTFEFVNGTASGDTHSLQRLATSVTVGSFVPGPPVITTQPLSQTGLVGSTLRLSVAATGAASYQWRRNGFALSDGSIYAGTTSPVLTLSNLSNLVAGTFTCTVANPVQSVLSAPAVVAMDNPIPALASDTFSNAADARDPGDGLTAVVTEVGGRPWTAHSSVVLGNGVLTTVPAAASHLAGFSFEPTQHLADPVATLEADVDPRGGEWVGMGFSRSAIGGYWTDGQVWMLLRGTGVVNVFAGGTTNLLTSVTATNFNAAGFNRLKLEVDFSRFTVSAWINGSVVLSGQALPIVPDVHFVGFHMYHGSVSPASPQKLDNFQVQVGGDPPVSEVVVGVDRNVPGYLQVLQGTATVSLSPLAAITPAASGTDNLWHVANSYISLPSLNAIVTHAELEKSARLTATVGGLANGAEYDLYGRFATPTLAAPPEYWGVEMGPTAADLARYDQSFACFTVLRNFGNWQEWEVYLGRVTAARGQVSLLLDDDTATRNVVWTGLRLAPPAGAAPVVASFEAVDDAFSSEATPKTNYGTADYLRVHGGVAGQTQYSWLKFGVSGVSGRVIRSRLKLRTQETALDETYLYRICTTDWNEATVNWVNHPAPFNCGYQTHRTALAGNSSQSFDLTSYVDGAGSFTLGLATSDPDLNLDFWSAEAATATHRPVLEVVYQP